MIRTAISGSTAEVQVEQQNGNFIFPLRLQVLTQQGKSIKKIVINNKSQLVKINMGSPIKSIEVDDSRTLVRLVDKKTG
jgi:hypothetical protein